MKILIFNWQDIKSPLGGGAEVHLHEIFRHIAADGHKVKLVAYRYDGSQQFENIDGIEVERYGSRNFFNFWVPYLYWKKYRKEDFDIVIDDINKIPFYTPLYVRKPLLAISHHFFGKSIFNQTGFLSGLYVVFAEKLIDFVYKKTNFVVVSESTLNEFLERGFDRKRFKIVENAISPEDFQMKVSKKLEDPTVAYFGRLKKYKSVQHLLLAFAEVVIRVPNAKLYILGRGDYQEDLENLAKELNIFEKTTFFGYVTEEDKKKILSEVHCVANTSIKEGWGITNIEANACGTCVISANVPGLKDSVKDGVSGLLYEYGNIEELSDKIYKVFTDMELQKTLSEGAVEWAEKFSWKNSAKKMLKICEEMIK